MKILLTTALGLVAAIAGATSYTGSGFSFVDATATTTGYASSTIAITDLATITSIDSVTLTGLTHTWIGDLEIDLYSPTLGTYVDLTSPPTEDSAQFNGTYTFLPSSTLNTVDLAAAGQSGLTLASGTYAMSTYGGVNSAGIAQMGARTDFNAFAGKQLAGLWLLEVWDYSAGNTGSLGSWTLNVTTNATPTPEPSSFAALGLAAFAIVRRNRKENRK